MSAATPLVVDAGVLAAALAQDSAFGSNARAALRDHSWHLPAHGPVEALAVLRKWARDNTVPGPRADNVAVQLGHLKTLTVHPLDREAAQRAWELRHNLSTYDAAYVALAERLGCAVLTVDGRMTNAPGPRCQFTVVPRD